MAVEGVQLGLTSEDHSGMGATDVESKLRTVRRLLSSVLTGKPSKESVPDPPVAELDALTGFGLLFGDDLRLSVYLMQAWGQGEEHAASLREHARASGRTAEVVVNGDLLLVATIAAQPHLDDRILLNELLSAFAGRE